MWTAKDARRSRPYTTALLDAVDIGIFDKDTLIADLLGWMSEAEVEQFIRRNDMLEPMGLDEDEEEEETEDADY